MEMVMRSTELKYLKGKEIEDKASCLISTFRRLPEVFENLAAGLKCLEIYFFLT